MGRSGCPQFLAISGAIVSLAFTDDGQWSRLPLALASSPASGIAAYTLFDGLGGRAAGDVLGYIAWLFVIDAVPFSLLVACLYRRRLGPALVACWRPAALGGALSVIAYGLVIWAMSLAPMAGCRRCARPA